jgi:hypothetical protein
MDLLTMSTPRARGRRFAVAGLVLAAVLLATTGLAADDVADVTPEVVVKAALLYNFAKFTEWPALAPDAPIVACIVGGDDIAAALAETVRGQKMLGHKVEVSRPQDSATGLCNLLFIADAKSAIRRRTGRSQRRCAAVSDGASRRRRHHRAGRGGRFAPRSTSMRARARCASAHDCSASPGLLRNASCSLPRHLPAASRWCASSRRPR